MKKKTFVWGLAFGRLQVKFLRVKLTLCVHVSPLSGQHKSSMSLGCAFWGEMKCNYSTAIWIRNKEHILSFIYLLKCHKKTTRNMIKLTISIINKSTGQRVMYTHDVLYTSLIRWAVCRYSGLKVQIYMDMIQWGWKGTR